jgi:4,5-DOPA dioxygenase extradiol
MLQQDYFNGQIMPVLFAGHGSPVNGIEENEFSRGWEVIAKTIPRPKAILCISAHWETNGTFVTAMEKPRTIYDFYGFPQALYRVKYPASGSPWLAKKTITALTSQLSWSLSGSTAGSPNTRTLSSNSLCSCLKA